MRDHGALLAVDDRKEQCLQYEIGKPLTAELMTRETLSAGLYAPLRVVVYVKRVRTIAEYDKPSSLVAQLGNKRATEIAACSTGRLGRPSRRRWDIKRTRPAQEHGLIVTQWFSSALGGYIAGRLRTKWTGIHTHEVTFRDTAHGRLAPLVTHCQRLAHGSKPGCDKGGSLVELEVYRNFSTSSQARMNVAFAKLC